ncbi:MAG TPA: hypothetical protein VJY62_15055 [Bacteroidia bacterium]|nr:hypothetical protein [Bacteroidia bacterium]
MIQKKEKKYSIEKLSIAQIPEEQINENLLKELRARASYIDCDKSLNEFLVGTADLLNIITDWESKTPLSDLVRDAIAEASQLYKRIHKYNYLQIVKI